MHEQLLEYLRGLASESEIVFCPNGGNAGDALIASATYELFAAAGISFTLFDPAHFKPEGKILIYGGGGNLVPLYPDARRIIERYHASVRRLILLPHTIQGHEDLLKALGPNVDLWTREYTSYDYVKQVTNGPRIFQADDLALSVSPATYLARGGGWCHLLSQHENSRYRKMKWALILLREYTRLRFAPANSKVLYAFRRDKERTRQTPPRWNIDVSRILKCKHPTPEQAACTSQMLFRFLNAYQEIETDRLHIAIAAALLGKRVKLYANSYYKCEAVYQYSLTERFPALQWMGHEQRSEVEDD
jgi:exopolysaccharide biosynthesis predicted pyruvyltransferase EpsI